MPMRSLLGFRSLVGVTLARNNNPAVSCRVRPGMVTQRVGSTSQMSDVRTSRSRKSASEVLTSTAYVVVDAYENAHLRMMTEREGEREIA